MKRCLLALAACGSPAPAHLDAPGEAATTIDARDATWIAYVGGYGGDIRWYSVDKATAALTMHGSVPQTGASFLAWDDPPAHLYAVDESNSRVVAYAIDATGALTKLNDASAGGSGPAHLTVSQGHVLVANYGDGTVSVLPIAADGSLSPATQTLTAGAHAHEVVIRGAFAFVPCLGADKVAEYTWNGSMLAPNGSMATATNAGPRHLAFSTTNAYLVDETASTLMALSDNAGQLAPLQTITTLPAGFTGQNTGAEVVVAGTTVWTSNRGADDIATFSAGADGRVTAIAHTPTGMTPRHFSITPDGLHLLVAAQGGNTVETFAIDLSTGTPSAIGQPVTVQAPSFVGIAALP